MVCSGFRVDVEDFGGEWEGVMVLEMGKGISWAMKNGISQV